MINKVGKNKEQDLLGKWFPLNPSKRKDIFLATKFGHLKHNPANLQDTRAINTTPEYCHDALEASLKRLGLPYGKIKYLGWSERSADSLRRAHATHPISCVQMEYNPFCLDIESPKYRLLETARELGVAIVAYSPLGNGLLSGTLRLKEDFTKPGDLRGGVPWVSDDDFQTNLAIVDKIGEIAKATGVTAAQLTLAWILAQGEDFLVIPGTTKVHRVAENLGSLDIIVTTAEEKAICQASERVVGGRFPEAIMEYCFADTPALEA
ncbi:NADP-dependent oxidoreductase domain-containing protein [Aspergillus sergii]|uniref:NADP-dependent oxidoreductase domain-containing protein n=1 Tax=Aspergillus sergii TaxID=1034303 RepID=A0A5N6XLN1_9EURO|nr:NADP-dependent oxidoreductase domain-containing protein [Aspergillus sergii]